MHKNSLKPLPPDSRDLTVGAFWDMPAPDSLPDTFALDAPLWIGDQNAAGESDFCSAYATCGASMYQENLPLYPAFSFAASKYLSGDPDDWGQDLRTACKAHQKLGALPQAHAPEHSLSSEQKRRFSSFSEEEKHMALSHRKKSYWRISGIYDSYDDIRATLHKFKTPVILGLEWGWPLSQFNIDTPKEGFGHALYCIGWSESGLIVVNSAGESAGDRGRHVLSREVVNANVPRYGAFAFTDLEAETAKYYSEYDIREGDNWLAMFKKILWRLFSSGIIQVPSMRERLYMSAHAFLGTDASSEDIADDELACAESFCRVVQDVIPDFPLILHTAELDDYLKRSPRFKGTLEPTRGNVIISPTGSGNGTIAGHVGIHLGNERIASNTSKNGLWEDNYSVKEWVQRFRHKGGMPIRYYELIT